MRVLDNLENYDIPSGFHLTAEQEEQLAADLKEIVLALIPLRSSKLKTRQYFSHPSSHHILRLLAAARPQVVSKSAHHRIGYFRAGFRGPLSDRMKGLV